MDKENFVSWEEHFMEEGLLPGSDLKATIRYALEIEQIKTKTIPGVGDIIMNERGKYVQILEMPGVTFDPMFGHDAPMIFPVGKKMAQLVTGEIVSLAA